MNLTITKCLLVYVLDHKHNFNLSLSLTFNVLPPVRSKNRAAKCGNNSVGSKFCVPKFREIAPNKSLIQCGFAAASNPVILSHFRQF